MTAVCFSFVSNDRYRVIASGPGMRIFLGYLELNTRGDIKGLGCINNLTDEWRLAEAYQKSLLRILEGRYVFRRSKALDPSFPLESESYAGPIRQKAEELNREHEKIAREILDETIRLLGEIKEDLD